MLEEGIKKLLDSDLEADNQLGWELIEAKQVPFKDVVEYVDSATVPTQWIQKYIWDGKKFYKNPMIGTHVSINALGTGALTVNSPSWAPNWSGNVTYTGTSIPTYSSQYLKLKDHEIQKEKALDKSSGVRENNKTLSKSSRGRLFDWAGALGKIWNKTK